MQEDFKLFKAKVSLSIILVLGIVIFALPLYQEGKNLKAAAAIGLAVLVAILSYIQIKRMKSDLAKGLPLVDERLKKIRQEASALAFNITIYWLLVLLWYNSLLVEVFNFPELSSLNIMVVSIVGALILFIISYFIVKKRVD